MAQIRRVKIGDRWVDLDAKGNEIRRGSIAPLPTPFESDLGDLQAAARRQKFHRALQGLMSAPLPKVDKNLMK